MKMAFHLFPEVLLFTEFLGVTCICAVNSCVTNRSYSGSGKGQSSFMGYPSWQAAFVLFVGVVVITLSHVPAGIYIICIQSITLNPKYTSCWYSKLALLFHRKQQTAPVLTVLQLLSSLPTFRCLENFFSPVPVLSLYWYIISVPHFCRHIQTLSLVHILFSFLSLSSTILSSTTSSIADTINKFTIAGAAGILQLN